MCADTELHSKRRQINPTPLLACTSAAGNLIWHFAVFRLERDPLRADGVLGA
jgi:hypothetical protein